MKLICKVSIGISGSAAPNRRATWGCIEVGYDGRMKERDPKHAVLICRTSRDSNETKYKLFKNVTVLHCKYLNEGRTSISLKVPNHIIFIDKAEITQLKKLNLLLRHLAFNEKPGPTPELTTEPGPLTFKAPVTSITVRNREEFEKKLGATRFNSIDPRYNHFVNKLHIYCCVLKLAPDYIRALKLVELSLKNVNLTSSSFVEIKSSRLQTLCLEDSMITVDLFSTAVTYDYVHSLTTLKLTGNILSDVPLGIFGFPNLNHLDLSFNSLTTIPDRLMSFPKLQQLILSYNNLEYLPTSIMTFRHLNKVEICSNLFNFNGINEAISPTSKILSLVELANRALLHHKIHVEAGMLPMTLLDDISNCKQCICGRKFINGGQQVRTLFNLEKVSSEVVYSASDAFQCVVPVRGTLCHSNASCYQTFTSAIS